MTECVRSIVPENDELVKNGDFSAGTTDWYPWGDVQRSVSGGVLNFWRTATVTAGGAVIFQDLNVQTHGGHAVRGLDWTWATAAALANTCG